tara:strand:+ start:366 stop:590 length:225 start_codon:yes stop_codon:yes gene_type:complete
MSAQTENNPTIMINEVEYNISDLSDDAKYFINCISNIDNQLAQIKMNQDTMNVAREGFSQRLEKLLEPPVSEES